MFVFLDANELNDFYAHWRSVAASYAASARLHQRQWDDGASVILARALDALAALPHRSLHERFDAPTLHVIFERLAQLRARCEDDLLRPAGPDEVTEVQARLKTLRTIEADLAAFVRAHEVRQHL